MLRMISGAETFNLSFSDSAKGLIDKDRMFNQG